MREIETRADDHLSHVLPVSLCSARARVLTPPRNRWKKCYFVVFAHNAFIAASESAVPPITQHAKNLQFTTLENSYVFAGIAVLMLTLSLLIVRFGSAVEDRHLVLFSTVWYAGSNILVLFIWTFEMHLGEFLLGEFALM